MRFSEISIGLLETEIRSKYLEETKSGEMCRRLDEKVCRTIIELVIDR